MPIQGLCGTVWCLLTQACLALITANTTSFPAKSEEIATLLLLLLRFVMTLDLLCCRLKDSVTASVIAARKVRMEHGLSGSLGQEDSDGGEPSEPEILFDNAEEGAQGPELHSESAQDVWQRTGAYMADIQQAFKQKPAVRIQGAERHMKLLLVRILLQREYKACSCMPAEAFYWENSNVVARSGRQYRASHYCVHEKEIVPKRDHCVFGTPAGGRAWLGQATLYQERLCPVLPRHRPARQLRGR